MKILKIFQEKLRYKNYSDRSIKLYTSYLSNFLKEMTFSQPLKMVGLSEPQVKLPI